MVASLGCLVVIVGGSLLSNTKATKSPEKHEKGEDGNTALLAFLQHFVSFVDVLIFVFESPFFWGCVEG